MSQIKIEYIGDLRTQSIHVDSGHEIVTDAPKDNQGLGRKFSPTDLLASSLGSCLLTIMGIVAKRHEIDMVGAIAKVNKKMSESPRRISELNVEIILNKLLNDKNIALLKKAAEHCPVHNSLSKEIDIKIIFN
tara:strand:- start:51 stop:449 length:399 start_codon:yes stop_codon:yes gene_type:complete